MPNSRSPATDANPNTTNTENLGSAILWYTTRPL